MNPALMPRVKLETEQLPDGELDLVELTGRETIGQLFQYEILAVCRDPSAVEIEELVGQEAALLFTRDGKEVRRVYGMISMISDRQETETAFSTYRITFVPRAFRLSLIETLDAFLDVSVPDVIRQKLTEAGFRERTGRERGPSTSGAGSAQMPMGQDPDGFDFEMRLHASYPTRDFIAQYQETDLAFVSRLCEHLGVSFFFEHDSGRDVMVFTDVNEGFRAVEGGPEVPYRGRGDHHDVYSLEETIKMIPAQYVVRDYNYRTPQVTLTGHAQVPTGLGSVVEYGSHVKTPDEAEKMAHVRAQERMAQRRVFTGETDLPILAAGGKIAVVGHPRGDTKLLLTEVRTTVYQLVADTRSTRQESFQADFKAINETRRFRPPRVTAKPRIHGVITGVIDSANESAQYADVDDQGRYRVRFLFDTTGPDKGKASKLVRMAQPHSGEGYGMHFPLRPGVEVIITFVDGDPDRPIIAATVPNPQTASPVAAGNAPRNIIRTGGGNEINIDDTQDATRIKMTVPHKSTTFQLGAPNSPEGGAMLETSGASSTVATTAISGFTAVKSGIAAFGEMKKGGWVSSIAEKPSWFVTASSVAEIMAAGIETASATFETAMAMWDANNDRLGVDATQAQVAAKNAAAKAAASRADATGAKLAAVQTPVAAAASTYDAAEAALVATTPVGSPGYAAAEAALLKQSGMADSQKASALNAQITAYQAAQAAYDTAETALRSDQEFLRDAEKGAATGQYTAEVELYTKAVAADEAALGLGNPPTGAALALANAKGALDTSLATTPAVPALAGASGATAQAAWLAAIDQSATDDDAANDAWDGAEAADKTYDTAVEDKENGDGAQGVEWTEQALGYLKIGVSLFSEVMSAISLANELKTKVAEMVKQVETVKAITDANPRDAVTAFTPRTAGTGGNLIFPIRNTLGSEGDTEVYAEKNLFLRSDNTTMAGEKTLVLAAFEQLALLSAEKTEIAAKAELKLTASVVDVRSGGGEIKLSTVSPPAATTASKGELTAEAKGKLTLESTEEDIEIRATAKKPPAQNISLLASKQIEGKADEVALTAATKASLLAGTFGLEAGIDSVTVGSKAWGLSIKDKNVQLGVVGAGAQLSITDSAVGLSAGGELTLAGNPITFKANTVDFGTATINTENLMIKGGVGGAYVAVKAKIDTAQAAAEAAQAAAKTANDAAVQAATAANTADAAAKTAQRTADGVAVKANEALTKLTLLNLAT